MRARAEVATAPSADGRVRLRRLRSEAPLVLRRSDAGVMLVAGAGGPLGGDDLRLDVEAADGTVLRVGSAAATVVQPGAGGGVARLTVRARVGRDASLTWVPEPTVVTEGGAFEARTTVTAGPGSSLVWREVLVLGRVDRPGGTVSSTLSVDVDGRPVLRQTTRAGPGAPPGWDGPAGWGGHRVLGTLLLLGRAADGVAPAAGGGASPYAVMPLEPGGVLVTALGATTLDVLRVLDAVPTQRERDAARRSGSAPTGG